MQCEICGKEQAEFLVELEGTQMNLGRNCSKMGKTIRKIRNEQAKNKTKIQQNPAFKPQNLSKEEPVEIIVKNYSELIKHAREQKGLKQEDFAKQLHEKESVLHSIESGHREPRIELARKLERMLGIKLVEQYEEKTMKYAANKDQPLTAGHLIQIKTRKKQK
ncbi:multiprotein bridging factor aMBF1 [Candidatus Woesearchaeota archaeon]|nr:multiprotein bridging factor aMBF1 [Candidatus Woesearchaeota archaeon]MCF8012960.1 multiprotein bridging factor aMBF1 [Candidatus Woesearchaeota archaeon]